MKIPLGFEMPTHGFAAKKIEKFKDENADTETALGLLLTAFPWNQNRAHVLLKVAAINSLYSTQIYGVKEVAGRIEKLSIDGRLESGDTDIVEEIASVSFASKNGDGDPIKRRNYSFATKYCAWHNSEKYPLYDSRVETCLRAYQQQEEFTEPFDWEDLRDFGRFRTVIDAFRSKYLDDFGYKELDMFLYQLGTDCFYS